MNSWPCGCQRSGRWEQLCGGLCPGGGKRSVRPLERHLGTDGEGQFHLDVNLAARLPSLRNPQSHPQSQQVPSWRKRLSRLEAHRSLGCDRGHSGPIAIPSPWPNVRTSGGDGCGAPWTFLFGACFVGGPRTLGRVDSHTHITHLSPATAPEITVRLPGCLYSFVFFSLSVLNCTWKAS